MENNVNILVIEDDPTICVDICLILESYGYHVVGPTHKVSRALEYLRQRTVDLAILDINLNSQESGIDLGHHIHEKVGIPFIYLTSYSDSDTIKSAVATQPANYIVKPFKEEDFKPAIELALAQRKKSKLSLPPLEIINKQLISFLTKTEYEILGYLIQGQNIKDIANRRFNSENTIKTHVKNIYSKMGVSSRVELFSVLNSMN